jgi:hypothetical protein
MEVEVENGAKSWVEVVAVRAGDGMAGRALEIGVSPFEDAEADIDESGWLACGFCSVDKG